MVQIRNAGLAILMTGSLYLPAKAQNQDTSFATYEQKIPNTTVSFRMVPIPAGSFLMGSPDKETGRRADEGPATKVFVDSFWMEEHEVTYDEYVLFSDEERDPEPKPDGITRPSPPYIDFTLGMGKGGGFPANSMSQYGALMYCQWLYKKTGIFYRLPTEAEWEYACRAGSSSAYPFREDKQQLDQYAWYAANSGNRYHAVKQLKPNAWGLYDMLGNVAEWTLDQYQADYFKRLGRDVRNPLMQPESKYPLSLRGGDFRDEASALRSAARIPSERKWNARDPQIPKSKWWNADAPFIGFRIVRPVKQPDAHEAGLFFARLLSIK
ncbi:MAG: SUMF1/EgtB/PvdO family nonheme iron enzyme [Bacteroidota bacterium]|nr:SUMF1/EgtB/PvdO family nonheme iron enzyme [Bacteroidota bacterium]MDP4211750.1 SUMF1/EgtB/PvdO family nonheme iron enzyme [Bacteroidota bacterium]MDP4251664.1 SUMF1/EgtB/PvdO family nonheme iron enzyme [Bacteroidota bacterium]